LQFADGFGPADVFDDLSPLAGFDFAHVLDC